jgi:hypothetical protein
MDATLAQRGGRVVVSGLGSKQLVDQSRDACSQKSAAVTRLSCSMAVILKLGAAQTDAVIGLVELELLSTTIVVVAWEAVGASGQEVNRELLTSLRFQQSCLLQTGAMPPSRDAYRLGPPTSFTLITLQNFRRVKRPKPWRFYILLSDCLVKSTHPPHLFSG